VFPDAAFYGSDGQFHPDARDYRLISAANWSASARYAGRVHGDILLIDIGSTTTDLIPVKGGIPGAGTTDFERLCRGELIYAGALRTNLATLLRTVEVKGCSARTSSELFAITGDAYLLLGRITAGDYTCDTPDGGPKDAEGAARRIARLVCCDLEELSAEEVLGIAAQAHRSQVDDLGRAIARLSGKHGLSRAAVCGLGGFLAKDALLELGMPFAQAGSEAISRVYPAYAVANLLEM
jgi:hypothetical protein